MDRVLFGCRPICWAGVLAVGGIPLALQGSLHRFAQLPQVLMLQVCALVGLGAWLWTGSRKWRQSPLVLPLGAFLLVDAVSILSAVNPVVSLLPVSIHIAGVLFVIVLLNGLSGSEFQTLIRFASIVAAVVSALGVVQYLGIGREWVPTAGLPSATLGHRNLAAAYLVGMLPFAFWGWWQAQKRRQIVLWGLALGLEGAFLIATRSRGAWVAVCATILVLAPGALFAGRPRLSALKPHLPGVRILSLALVCLFLLSTALRPAQIGKGAGEAMWQEKQSFGGAVSSVFEAGGDKGRLALWRRTLDMVAANPVRGVGVGNWRLVYPVYAQGDMVNLQTQAFRPHNDLLWIWAEMGTAGAGLYVYLLWVAFRNGLRITKKGPNRLLGGVLLGSLAGCVVNSLFSFPRAFPAAWLPFYLTLAGIAVLEDAPHRVVGRLPALLWAGCVLLVVGIGFTGMQMGFDRHALQMRIAFAEARWPAVVREATRALGRGPFDEEAFLMRGRAYAALGNPGQALADYRRGLAYHPNSVGLWNGVGNSLQALGNPSGAARAFYRALEMDPGSGETYNNLGTLHAMAGALDSALVAYQLAVKYQPNLVAAHANLSIAYRKMGDLPRALGAARRALERHPEHLEALNALGNAHMSAGDFGAAARVFLRALAVDTSKVQIYFNLGQAYEKQGERLQAVRAYETFLKKWQGGNVPPVRVARRRVQALRDSSRVGDGG